MKEFRNVRGRRIASRVACRGGPRPPQGVQAPRQEGGPVRAQEAGGAAGRHVHDRAGRVRRDPGSERLGEVDAGPAALDAALPRRRQRRGVRPRRLHGAAPRAQARQPRLGRGQLLQEDVGRREPALRGALLRHGAARDPRQDPRDPDQGRFPGRPAQRADGKPLARDAAEGRARAGAAHLAGAAPAGRADHRPRPSLQARGAGVRPRGARDARRDDPALHARPRRGRGARGPRRDPRPRRAPLPRERAGDPEALRRRHARAGVLRGDGPRVRGRADEDDEDREVFA